MFGEYAEPQVVEGRQEKQTAERYAATRAVVPPRQAALYAGRC